MHTGPFNEIVSSEIVVKNFSKKTVGFKVKTTAPKQYCVRPNCGYVEPGKSVVITSNLDMFNFCLIKITFNFCIFVKDSKSQASYLLERKCCMFSYNVCK